jgi:hypothetical protein
MGLPLRASLALAVVGAACAPTIFAITTDASAPRDVAVTLPDRPTLSTNDVPPTTDASVDGAGLGAPAEVSVVVLTTGTCEALTACGGDVRGTWDVAAVCLEVPIEETVNRCPGGRVTRREGRASGRVIFGSGFAQRRAQWTAEVEVFIPGVCAGFLGGCPGIQSTVRAVAPDTTCVMEGLGDCRCTARQSGTLADGDGYDTASGQIVSSSLGRRWDYCIAADRLRYRDVSATGPREPGTITLARRL